MQMISTKDVRSRGDRLVGMAMVHQARTILKQTNRETTPCTADPSGSTDEYTPTSLSWLRGHTANRGGRIIPTNLNGIDSHLDSL